MANEPVETPSVVKPLQPTSQFNYVVFVVILVASLALGVGAGYLFATGLSSTMGKGGIAMSGKKKAAGLMDKKRFPDKAEGVLKEGGIEGEGNFHLVRPGGESQNVYLTSSIVDLSEFLNKKVRVWGETFQAQKAGWLMDVGYVEAL